MKTRNSMKSLLLVLSLVCSTMLQAQSNYQTKLKELFEVNTTMSGMDLNQQQEAYAKMLQAGGISGEQAKALSAEYFRTQFMNDLVTVVTPYYQSVLSEADINNLLSKFNTPEGKTAMAHIGKASAAMSSPEAQAFIQNSLIALLQGQQVSELKPEACGAVYQQKFEEYYIVSNIESSVASTISSLEPMLMAQAKTESQKMGMRKTLDAVGQFLTKNMKVFSLNAFYPEVTEADLDFFVGVMKTPAGQNMNKGNAALTNDALNMGQKVVQGFVDWVRKQQ